MELENIQSNPPEKIESISYCKNCDAELTGEFCSQCGQSTYDFEKPMINIVTEFASTIFAFDTRLFTSIKALFLSPGKYTLDYINGKRVRYAPPFRLFAFISFFFFLLMAISLKQTTSFIDDKREDIITQLDKSTTKTNDNEEKTAAQNNTNFSINLGDEDETKIKEVIKSVIQNPNLYIDSFVKFLSWSVFFSIPIYAFLLWLFFRKNQPYYFSHLIFDINQNSFIFILFIINTLIKLIFPDRNSQPELFLLFLIPIYTIWGYKRVYQSSWISSVIKHTFISTLYSLVLTVNLAMVFYIWIKIEFL